MGRTSARATIFFSATFLLLYAIAVATVSFKGLNVTAFHLSQPLLIGYGVFWVIVAPSGLWGIFGSTQNNTDLCNRYLRDHWFSSAFISTVDVIKIIFSFTMKDNSIQKCLASTDGSGTSIDNCRKKADLFQKAGLIAFVAQGLLLIGLGLLTWLSCRRLMKKKGEKTKEVLKNDLETQNKHQLNDDDRVNNEIRDSAMSLERTETNLPSLFTRRPSQYSDNSNKSNRGQKGPDEQEKIKKDENDEDIVRLREDQEGNIRNLDNVDYIKDVNINNVKNADNINNIKNVDNINDTKNANDINNVKNFKNLQRFDQQQYATIPQRSRRSYDRQMILSDELQGPPPPKGMNQMAPISRSKSMAPPVRSNSNILPPPLPEYRFMQPIQYPQGIQGMRNHRVPLPPPYYYNRPPPLPQFQQIPNFRPLYPWQQQWMGFNNGPNPPPQGDFRGHRRSKSHPELRPLPFPPSSNPSQIPKQRTIPSQIIEQQIPVIVDSKNSKNRNKYENENETETKNENENNNNTTKNASATNSRRYSTSSRYKQPLSSIIEQKRPYSQMHRANSLPNLSEHEDLMRNEMLFAPPVPPIPSSLQSDTKNSNNKDKLNNKNTIIDNTDKFEKFIKMYGNKEYDMSSENPHYNKYSGLQQNNDKNGWNTNENDDYVPPKRKRPKSAQSVRGEASPKSSIYVDDNKDSYYNDYYYYGPPSGYIMNQEMMNSRNSNYFYTAPYVGPMGYNNGHYNPMGYNGGRVNYGQQRPQRMNYYY